MNIVIALVIIYGSYSTPIPMVENDVFVGNQLPYWGTLCENVDVYGNPEGMNEPHYTLPKGERVTLRELSDNYWVMIKPAKWIPLSAVCPWGE